MENFVKPEYLQKIQEPEAKFILEHAEKQLKEILLTGETVVTRTTMLLTLTVGLLVGLVGFAINRWVAISRLDTLLTSALISILYLFIPVFFLAKLILPTEYSITGAQPISFFVANFFDEQIEKERRLTHIYLNEIYNYQIKIVTNKLKNEKRWRTYTKAFVCIAFAPLVFILIFLATNVFSSLISS